MKKIISLFTLLLAYLVFSQVQKLHELSQGKMIDYAIIYEDGKDDVFGYLLLYEFDRKSKEVYELEYVVLDKNLNKLTSSTFLQGMYSNILLNFKIQINSIKKIGNEIIIGLHDYDSNSARPKINYRYRRLNLDDFSFSTEFIIREFKVSDKEYKPGQVTRVLDLWDEQSFSPTNGDYFLAFATPEHNPKIGGNISKTRRSIKSFAILDKDLNVVWKKAINTQEKGKEYDFYSYWESDKSTLILQKEKFDSKEKQPISLEIYNINTGSLIDEILLNDPNYGLLPETVKIIGEQIVIFSRMFELKKDKYDEKCLGYSKLILDKNTGKELRRDYLPWEKFAPHLILDKYGKINQYGKILPQEFVYLENGNTLMIAEGYNQKKSSEILDLFAVEFNPDLTIKFLKKIDKNKISLKQIDQSGISLFRYGFFDYLYQQKLNNNGDHVFFYANNEREGSRNTKRKNPNWILGIVTYVDGQFNFDKLQLTTGDSQIYPGKAKNGYIQLFEVGNNNAEMRLEKINY